MANTMDAGRIIIRRMLVTIGAVRGPGRDTVIRVFCGDIRVATGTGVRVVNGSNKFSLVNEERNFFAELICFREGFVGVAIQAGAIGICIGRRG